MGAHKGSGLSIVVDLLAGAISTGKSSDPKDTVLRNNMLSIYIAPAIYDSEGAIAPEIKRFVEWVKASPPVAPGQAVLLPGEVERRSRERRSVDGIPIDDKTWNDLLAAAESVGIAARAAEAAIEP